MTTLNLTLENKERTAFINFSNTKRAKWSNYRRYSL